MASKYPKCCWVWWWISKRFAALAAIAVDLLGVRVDVDLATIAVEPVQSLTFADLEQHALFEVVLLTGLAARRVATDLDACEGARLNVAGRIPDVFGDVARVIVGTEDRRHELVVLRADLVRETVELLALNEADDLVGRERLKPAVTQAVGLRCQELLHAMVLARLGVIDVGQVDVRR